MIRRALPEDSPSLISMAHASGLFQPKEAETLLGGILQEFHEGQLGENHQIELFEDAGTREPLGWVYFAPSFKAEGIWDLWWIGVHPDVHGRGIGSQLLAFVEQKVPAKNGRIVIIETSHTPPTHKARSLYEKRGYMKCGQIPDFYGDGDDKIIYAKKLK